MLLELYLVSAAAGILVKRPKSKTRKKPRSQPTRLPVQPNNPHDIEHFRRCIRERRTP